MLLAWTLLFLIIAGIAAWLKLTTCAFIAMMITLALFFICVTLFSISMVFYVIRKMS